MKPTNPWIMTPKQLAKSLDSGRVDPVKAKEIMDEWKRLYPQITEWRKKLDSMTRDKEGERP